MNSNNYSSPAHIPKGFKKVISFAPESKPQEKHVEPRESVFNHTYKESTALKIIGKSLNLVSSVKDSVNNVVDKVKAKSLVEDLETAARAKKAIEELTDTRKPLKIECDSTSSVADELRKLAEL
ncbi:MAG: hypothetical protein II929_07765 [Succinivibrio sp.]|nr:hypothetical protein [Succinivibrio sp.]